MAMEITKRASVSTTAKSQRVILLTQLATGLGQRADDERIELYRIKLADLPEDLFRAACDAALTRCRFFPTMAELREFSGEIALKHQREIATQKTKELLNATRPADDFRNFKLEDIYAEINQERAILRERDLQFVITEADRQSFHSGGYRKCRCPKHGDNQFGALDYSCFLRITAAHKGQPVRTAQQDAALLPSYGVAVGAMSREPGCDDQ